MNNLIRIFSYIFSRNSYSITTIQFYDRRIILLIINSIEVNEPYIFLVNNENHANKKYAGKYSSGDKEAHGK